MPKKSEPLEEIQDQSVAVYMSATLLQRIDNLIADRMREGDRLSRSRVCVAALESYLKKQELMR